LGHRGRHSSGHGLTAQYKTKTVDDNGFNPSWNETFHFKVTRPDLALVRFCVMVRRSPPHRRASAGSAGAHAPRTLASWRAPPNQDYDAAGSDDFIASNTIPFECLQCGYRMVSLYDDKWHRLELSSLFVHIKVEDA